MRTMTLEERLARARTGFLFGEYDMVERMLEKIVLEKPHLPNVYNILGSVYERKGKYKDAIQAFHKAIELKPDNGEAYNNLGVAYKNSGDTDKAYTILQKALHVTRNKVDIYYNLGNLYRDRADYEKSEEYYRKSLELNPAYILAYNNLGTVLEKMKRDDEAVRVYRQGLQIDINHPRLHYNLGVIFKRNGLFKQAKSEFEFALRISHGWTQAMNNLGVVYQELGEPERALQIFRDILKTEPQNSEVHNNIGVLLQKQKNYDEAADAFNTSIRFNPQYTRAHFNLALLFAERGFHKEALEQLQKIKEFDPHDIQVQFREGSVLMVLGRFDEAKKCFMRVLAQDPSSIDTLVALANICIKQGEIQTAYDIQKKLAALGYRNAEFHLELAFIYREKANFKKAEQEVKLYLEQNPGDENARFLLADLCYKQNNLSFAQNILAGLIKGGSTQEEVYYLLAGIYREQGDYPSAVAVLKQIVEKQGSSEEIQDVDKLTESLKLYEETINEYEKEHEEQWQRNLIKYRDLGEDLEKEQADDEDAFLFDEQISDEDDAVPIIKVGGMEPVLAVREEEEELTLEESPEPIPETEIKKVIEIKEEKAPSLMNLLDGQELYRESPHAPFPQAGYAAPAAPPSAVSGTVGAAGTGGHGSPGNRESAYGPGDSGGAGGSETGTEAEYRQPGEERPEEQLAGYENTLKSLTNTLQNAVDAAGRAIQQNAQNIQSRGGARVSGPPPQGGGMPQYAPQYIVVPQSPLPVEISYRAGKQGEPEENPDLEKDRSGRAVNDEVGEELDRQEHTEMELPQQQESDDIGQEAVEEDVTAEQEEPEIELLEQAEDALTSGNEDMLSPGEAETEGDELEIDDAESGETAAGAFPTEKDDENLGMLQEEAEQGVAVSPINQEQAAFFGEKPRIQNKQSGKLLDYLANMANYLPQDEQFLRLENEIHLKMQKIRAKLSGSKGLMRKIREHYQANPRPAVLPITADAITSTFNFIKNLSSYVPNKETGTQLALKIDSILDKMRSV